MRSRVSVERGRGLAAGSARRGAHGTPKRAVRPAHPASWPAWALGGGTGRSKPLASLAQGHPASLSQIAQSGNRDTAFPSSPFPAQRIDVAHITRQPSQIKSKSNQPSGTCCLYTLHTFVRFLCIECSSACPLLSVHRIRWITTVSVALRANVSPKGNQIDAPAFDNSNDRTPRPDNSLASICVAHLTKARLAAHAAHAAHSCTPQWQSQRSACRVVSL